MARVSLVGFQKFALVRYLLLYQTHAPPHWLYYQQRFGALEVEAAGCIRLYAASSDLSLCPGRHGTLQSINMKCGLGSSRPVAVDLAFSEYKACLTAAVAESPSRTSIEARLLMRVHYCGIQYLPYWMIGVDAHGLLAGLACVRLHRPCPVDVTAVGRSRGCRDPCRSQGPKPELKGAGTPHPGTRARALSFQHTSPSYTTYNSVVSSTFI